MKIEEANELLKPGYLPFEAGYQRLDDGVLLVAARSSLLGCKGKMVDWWFSFIESTADYKRWHPTDHVYSAWEGVRGTGEYIGGTHLVHEYLAGPPVIYKLKINFRDPAEILDVSLFAGAGVSTAVHARIGMIDAPGFAGKMVHFVRDTPYGCEMRSRFWLGLFQENDIPNSVQSRKEIFPDEFGARLCQHCHEEMSILGTILPDLYAGHQK